MSDGRIKLFFRAHVPPGLVKAWMQNMRTFDAAHPGCHFEMMVDDMGLSVNEMVELLKVDPKLTFTQIIERGRE